MDIKIVKWFRLAVVIYGVLFAGSTLLCTTLFNVTPADYFGFLIEGLTAMKLYMLLSLKNVISLIVKTLDLDEFNKTIPEIKDVWTTNDTKSKNKPWYNMITLHPYISCVIAGLMFGLIIFFITGGSYNFNGNTPSNGENKGIIKNIVGYISSYFFSESSEIEKINNLPSVRNQKRPTLQDRLRNLDIQRMRDQGPFTPPNSSSSEDVEETVSSSGTETPRAIPHNNEDAERWRGEKPDFSEMDTYFYTPGEDSDKDEVGDEDQADDTPSHNRYSVLTVDEMEED